MEAKFNGHWKEFTIKQIPEKLSQKKRYDVFTYNAVYHEPTTACAGFIVSGKESLIKWTLCLDFCCICLVLSLTMITIIIVTSGKAYFSIVIVLSMSYIFLIYCRCLVSSHDKYVVSVTYYCFLSCRTLA